MKKEELQAIAQAAAEGIKREAELHELRQMRKVSTSYGQSFKR